MTAPRSATRNSRRCRRITTRRKIFEIMLLCGFYRTVSYLANGLALPLEAKAARFPELSRHSEGERSERTRPFLELDARWVRPSAPPCNDGGSALRHARAQHVVQMHDADRLAGLGDDQHGHRDLRRIDRSPAFRWRACRGGMVFGFFVITSSTGAVIRSGRMWRRRSPSVMMPAISPRASTMQTQPKPLVDISTSASDILAPSGFTRDRRRRYA